MDHENVVALKDIISPPQRESFNDVYIAYELMDTDLHQIIRSNQALSEEHWQLRGTPLEAELGFLNETAKGYIRQFPPYHRQSFTEKFPHVQPLAIDRIEKMLIFNPRQRITVEHALSHPYLNSLHDISNEPIRMTPLSFDFEQHDLTEQQMKEVMYRESVAFNPEYLKP